MTAASDPHGTALDIARELILRPAGLDESRIDGALSTLLGSRIDFADLYFELSHEESWSLEDGIVKEGHASIDQGVGVRALSGEKTGFAYSDEIVLPALEEAARAARAIAAAGGRGRRRCSASRAVTGCTCRLIRA
jgi:TldD protein